MSETPGKIFVSHAGDDAKYVTEFVNKILFLGCQLLPAQVLYSSQRATGFKTGSNLFEAMKEEAIKSPLMIAIVSPTYLTRSTCIAESGAAWALGTLFPVLTPGVKRSDLTGPLQSLLINEFDSNDPASLADSSLDEIFDTVEKVFQHNPNVTAWNSHKYSWLARAYKDADLLAPSPRTYTEADMKSIQKKLDNKIRQTEAQSVAIADLEDRYAELLAAKTKSQVVAATMPKEETGQFHKLADDVKTYFRDENLPRCVIKAIRYDVSNQDLILPGTFDDADGENPDFYKAEDRGLLMIEAEPPAEVTVNKGHPIIEGALERVEAFVHWFDSGDRSDQFHVWFKEKYKLPVSSRNADVWDAVLT